MSVEYTYSASGTHRALAHGTSEGYLHIRQQSPLVSGMREPPAPGVPRTDAAMVPPRAGPRAHGPRCACVPVSRGEGGLACRSRALACRCRVGRGGWRAGVAWGGGAGQSSGRAAGDSCTRRRYQQPCYQLPCPSDSMCAARASHPRWAGQRAHPTCT